MNARSKDRVIYALHDPVTHQIRYIGLSNYGISSRLSSHIRKAGLGERGHKANWIRSLLSQNLKPYATMLFKPQDSEDLNEAEKFFINLYSSFGLPLTNSTLGGEGTLGYIHTQETLKKLSKIAEDNYKNNPEHPWTKRHVSVEHKFIDGVESRVCSTCKDWYPLSAFHRGREWDGLFHSCKACEHVRTHKRRFNRDVAWDINFNLKPELNKTKQIKAVSLDGKTTLRFKSVNEAVEAGFAQPNILRAKKSGKAYRGFFWSEW